MVAVLLPAIVAGLALVVDTALVFQARREALGLADAAAQYGAAQIDQAAKRSEPRDPAPVNVSRAAAMTRNYVLLHRPDASVQTTVTRQEVEVDVTLQASTIIWHMPGASTVAVHASGAAKPFTGVATGQAP
jgi:hypothetical protein